MEENNIQTNADSDVGLDLNTKILEKGSDDYSSLTDTNNVSLFNVEFRDKVEALKNDKKKKNKELSAKVFLKQLKDRKETKDIKSQLFTTSTTSTIKQEETEKTSNNTYIFIMFAVILIFAVVMTEYVHIKKRKQKVRQAVELKNEREKYNDK